MLQVMKPHAATPRHMLGWEDDDISPLITTHKTICHPGEVNRIREIPLANHIVANPYRWQGCLRVELEFTGT